MINGTLESKGNMNVFNSILISKSRLKTLYSSQFLTDKEEIFSL